MMSFKNIRENSDKYDFINPLIGGISAPATDVGIFSDIKADIESYLNTEKKEGNLYDYSFYFRDMDSGLWFGSNEGTNFSPASLFKLPIAIAVYKEGEDDPSFLKKVVTYTSDISKINAQVKENAESTLVVGKPYSIEDLVTIMLDASDNGAKNLLLVSMDRKYLSQLFSVMSLVNPETTKGYTISSRGYALFLRILYGSSYLNEEHSELLLKSLSKSDFKDGIVAGLPSSIPVAHKFGVYDVTDFVGGNLGTVQQLHDCGVIYYPAHPYILCFMTRGNNLKSLYNIVSHVSKMVYTYQDEVKQK
jgi:beta-lactamase class A